MQQGTQQLDLWEALQRQQASTAPGGFAAPLNGVPSMLASGGAGSGMQPLPGFVISDGGAGGGQQPMVLSGKAPGFGGSAPGGISGLPNSLTSLPGMPYPSPSPPPTAQQGQPQLFGGGGPLGMPPPLPMQLGGGMAGTFAQSSGLGSQVSSAMALGGMGGSGLVPNHPSPTLQLSAHMQPGMAQQAAPQPLSLQQLQQLQGMQGMQQMQGAQQMQGMQGMQGVQQMQGMQPGGPAMGMAGLQLPPMPGIATQPLFKLEPDDPALPSSSHSVAVPLPVPGSPQSEDDGEGDGDGSPADCMGSGGLNKSRYRGVSYDRKKAKWRVQIKVAALGKSGVSVGYFDTEEAAARAYDRAAIGLLGRDNPNLQTNFDARDYTGETIPPLTGKTREEVKTTLKSERIKQQAPRRRFTSRQRTSRFMGVGSSNRKNQWQARILVHGKVTHLGYYETEEEAARVYDKVSLALHGEGAQTNFAASNYRPEDVAQYSGLDREDLQRALGVKPMDKSSKYRGVSKKKGKWEAKVMVNRRWAYRELFDSEEEAARAYDRALWRLKPKEAHSYVNFKDEVPPEVAGMVAEGGGGGGGGHAPRHARHGSRGARLSSEEEEEEEAVSEGSEEMSDEDGSGGTPQRPSWAARGATRSTRRPGLRGSVPAPARVASAPDLRAAQQQSASPPPQQAQQVQQAQQAQQAQQPAGPGFVALPGGGLQLQFGGGAAPPPSPASFFGGPASPATAPELQSAPLQLPGGVQGAGQPLLVRVGSETHLIPHQQQPAAAPPAGAAGAAGGSTLGKRMSRIQSEPSFAFVKEEPSSSLGGDLGDLMNDRDLFKAFELGPETGSPELSGGGGGGGSGAAGGQGLGSLDLDTSELLDFIKDMPDAPVHHGGGLGGGGGGGRAGMFKSRSMGNLMDLSAPFFDEEDAALAAMEFARPRKMSKSMSTSQLAGMEAQQGATTGRPPLPPSSGGSDKLGPLGKPIRRTNTFSSSLAVLQEHHTEGGRGGEELAPAPQGPGLGSGHGSGDDLVQRLLSPSPGLPADEDPVASMLADL